MGRLEEDTAKTRNNGEEAIAVAAAERGVGVEAGGPSPPHVLPDTTYAPPEFGGVWNCVGRARSKGGMGEGFGVEGTRCWDGLKGTTADGDTAVPNERELAAFAL